MTEPTPPAPLASTPLYAWHVAHGARMTNFGGWSMPIQYTSIVEEHHAVRRRAGLFDISHMGRLAFVGPDQLAWLERTTTNQVARLKVGQIQYSLMTNASGGVLDDVLVYRSPDGYAMVCNASNRARVLGHLAEHAGGLDAEVQDGTSSLAMVALQGPSAASVLARIFDPADALTTLKYYHFLRGTTLGADAWVGRSGYTGEDGFEVVVARDRAVELWDALLAAGQVEQVIPCGLGARDTLRLEAGMPLHGHELSEEINPFAAGLAWAVKLDKGDFVGREALVRLKENPGRVRVGLLLEGQRIARQGYLVLQGGEPVGVVSSGTFAPTLERSAAMAFVESSLSALGTRLEVDVRGRPSPAEVVPLPFYRRIRS